MFSFHGKPARGESGELRPIRPVAKIIDGGMDGRILYLYEHPGTPIDKSAGFFDRIQLSESDGALQWLPDVRPNQTDAAVCCAVRGAGKSTAVAAMAQTIRDMFHVPANRIWLIKKDDAYDAAFKELDPQLITCDESLVSAPLTVNDFAAPGDLPGICIIDDIDVIPSARVKKAAIDLMNSLMVEGRKRGIYVLVACHRLARGSESKYLLSEASVLGWAPRGQTSDTAYALERYADVSRGFLTDLKKTQKSRFIWFAPHHPRFLLCDRMAMVYDSDREAARVGAERAVVREEIKERARGAIAGKRAGEAATFVNDYAESGGALAPPQAFRRWKPEPLEDNVASYSDDGETAPPKPARSRRAPRK
jgi:hypothetical protein